MDNLTHFSVKTISDMVGEEHVSVMLENFLLSIQTFWDEFKFEWKKNKDSQRIKNLTHKMKSSSRFIGAFSLAEQLVYIEKNIESSNGLLNDDRIYNRLLNEMSMLTEEIHDYLNEGKDNGN